MNIFVIFTVILCIYTLKVQSVSVDESKTFDILFNAGVEAYHTERWYECMENMQQALRLYKEYYENIIDCRLRCEVGSKTEVPYDIYLDLAFFDTAMKRSDCLRKCKSIRYHAGIEAIDEDVKKDFEDLKPYDYIQICAYKIDELEIAMSAAYTFYLANPEHESMKNNVQYYMSMPEAKREYFKNLEMKPYQEAYISAVDTYSDGKYEEVVEKMEFVLQEYYKEDDKCRVGCEGPYDHESLPDFYNAIADHWIAVLKCRQKCPDKLRTFNGAVLDNFLPELYNYLQYSYYQSGDVQKAARATASYLLFMPGDEVMTKNQNFYLQQEGISQEELVAFPEAAQYVRRAEIEQQSLDFISQVYKFSDADEDLGNVEDKMDKIRGPVVDSDNRLLYKTENHKAEENDQDNPTTSDASVRSLFADEDEFLPKDEEYVTSFEEYRKEAGFEIVAEDDSLGGKNRVVVDSFLSEEECSNLLDLAVSEASVGDGYKIKKEQTSPHTNYEMFEGLTVDKAAELMKDGTITPEQAEFYLTTSEKAREFTQNYFNVKRTLYFGFTHLVCRSALDKVEQDDRSDLSHPIHTDNCILQSDGSCLRVKPAYTERDFSALLYLNDDFEGGNFFFAHNSTTPQKTLSPKCGRLVGFESGTFHGVEAITHGKRCALALWFTLDPYSQELSHAAAKTALYQVRNQNRILNQNEVLKQLVSENGYSISFTEKDLNGPERFVGDDILSKEQCDMLIKLAKDGAQINDGYGLKGGLASPHSQYESFAGLTVKRAAEMAAEGTLLPEAVRLYLNSSHSALEFTRTYFVPDLPLYFDFTHLVCRTALDESNQDRQDLSHPIHSDNCLIQRDGSCKKQPPAYTQRDYSALIYLSDYGTDFTGGEFFFTHNNMSVQSSVQPKCGRMVGFNAGNYHGVKAVLTGQRCAVALWYTLDSRYKEAAHTIADDILKRLEQKHVLHGGEL